MSPSLSPKARRALTTIMLASVTVAAVGFFTGTSRQPLKGGYRFPDEPRQHAVPTAPRQADMADARYAGRRAQQAGAFAALATPPTRDQPRVGYAEELAARSARRAYDGAPPAIPHAVDQTSSAACLACHDRGLAVEGRMARPVSHPPFAHCLQCHAPQDSVPPPPRSHAAEPDMGSHFAGLRPAGAGGPRAWPGAPPQMPHRSFMRERCTSCHGAWAGGLASTHPQRQNCRQCHTPAATQDQLPAITLGARFPAELSDE